MGTRARDGTESRRNRRDVEIGLAAERVGFDPSRAIHFGGPTTDEMDLGWHTYSIDGKGVSGADD